MTNPISSCSLRLLALSLLFATGLPVSPTEAAVGITVTKRDQLLTDANGNGLVSPGDTLKYTVVITNSGAGGTTTGGNVMFSDPIDPNLTLIPESVNSSPIARNDSYSAIGNVAISILSAQGLLVNDNDPDAMGPALTVVSFQNPSANGGNVIVTNDGSFFYNPFPGFEGIDTFTYTISDGEGFTDMATVSITVTGMIWFINSAATPPGDGRLTAPFSSVANFVALAADGVGDNIFLFTGSYTGPLTLLNTQRLIGQGATASIQAITGLTPPAGSLALPSTGGTRPTLSHSANNLTLASGNLARGLDLRNTGGTALTGSSIGALTISEMVVTNSNGAAVNLNNGVPDVTFDRVDSAGGVSGIVLANAGGSFTITGSGATPGSGGTIKNSTGDGISLSSAQNIKLRNMVVTNSNGNGILGSSVTNVQIVGSIIRDNDADHPTGVNESGIRFNNLFGNSAVSNTVVSGTKGDGIRLENNSGNLPVLAVMNCVLGPNPVGTGANGMVVNCSGTATGAVVVTGTTFTNNQTSGFLTSFGDTSSWTAYISNCVFNGNNMGADIGGGLRHTSFVIENSTFLNHVGSALNIISDANATSLAKFQGKILNNTIGNGTLDSGSRDAYGIAIDLRGDVDATFEVRGNHVRNGDFGGISIQSRLDNDADSEHGTNHLSLTGNTVGTPDDNSAFPLGFAYTVLIEARNESTVCADIQSNTISPGVGGAEALRVRQRDTAIFKLERLSDGDATPNELIAVEATIEARLTTDNPATLTRDAEFALGFTEALDGACRHTSIPAPPAPPAPLLFAEHVASFPVVHNPATPRAPSLESGHVLSKAGLAPIIAAARQRWETSGLTAEQMKALGEVQFDLAELAGWYLAEFAGSVVRIDLDAAGNGWFIDPTPEDDAEFHAGPALTRLAASPGSAVASRIDLLTTVLHEMGHALGVSDSHSEEAREKLMFGSLIQGERRLPAKDEAKGAIPGSVIGTHFVTVPLTIGDLPPGKSVTIVFNTIVTNPFPTGVCQVTNQAAISGNNFTTVLTDDPDTGAPGDATATAVFIPPTITFCPLNVVTNTTGSCGQTVAFAATAEGCPPPVIVYRISGTNVSSPFFFPVGMTTVSVTATNAAGTNTCSFTVTVSDNEPPLLVCTNIIVSTDSNQCSAVVTFATNATDNCAVTNVTFTPPSGSVFAKGTNTVTGVVTDSAGNTNGCTFLVIVNDTQAPAFDCPTNIIVEADSGACSRSNVTYSATATDNCDGSVPVTFSPPSGSTFPVGTNTVTATSVDSSGNTNTCTFAVIVTDTQPPMITCSSNVLAFAGTESSVVVNYSAPVVSDNCGVLTNFCSPPSGSSFPLGTNTVTCTVVDASTNSSMCQFTVTVIQCAITCPTNMVVNITSNCGAEVTFSDPEIVGDCGGGVACVPPSGSFFPAGTNVVTCTTVSGASCSFTVVVDHNVLPAIQCPSDIVTNTDAGQCTKSNVTFSATATDDCGSNVVVVCTPPSGSTFSKGTNTVTCVAVDNTGNTNSCSFTVAVLDMEAPSITCSTNIVVPADGGTCSASNVLFNVTAADNCPGVGTPVCSPPSGASFAKGVTTVECSVTDASGNTNACSFTVTVLDTQAPSITCSTNIVADADMGQCSKSNVTFVVTATDNCDANPGVVCVPPSGSTFLVGTNGVVCTATDSSGNTNICAFQVTIFDVELPSITCSSNLVVTAGTNPCVAVNFAPVVGDNCAIATNFCSPPSGTCFPVGTNMVTCTAIDTSSNSTTCTFTIVVVPCALTCPSNIVVTNDPGQCGAVVNFTNTISGDCGTVTSSPPSGSFFPVGTTTVTSTSSFGPSCAFTVTVLDVEQPVINCPSNIVAGTDLGQCSKSNVTFTVTASDNCGAGGGTLHAENFNANDGGCTVTNNRVFEGPWTYNAGAGTWMTAGQGPEIGTPGPSTRLTCPPVTVTQSGNVQVSFVHRYSFENGRWDGGQVQISVNGGAFVAVSGASFLANGYNGTLLANSAAELAGQAGFVETSAGYGFPSYITSVADLGLFNAGDTVSLRFVASYDTNTRQGHPAWEIDGVSLSQSAGTPGPVPVVCSPPSGSTFVKGTTTVNCSVVDSASNSNSCSFTVTIQDDEPPAMICSTNQMLVADSGQCSRTNVTFTVTATDNCDGTRPVVCVPPSGSTFGVGTNVVVCTASDTSGNTNSCSFSVVVLDVQPPSITGVSVTPASLWPPNHKMRDVMVVYTATDACGAPACVLSVTSNEPVDGHGDGDRAPDWEIVDEHHVRLRAERMPHGNGRIYTIYISCTDSSGNSTTNPVTVVVAHNITSPGSGASFKVNTAVSFAGTFWDIPGNRHTAVWQFDNLTTSGSVTEPVGLKNGSVKGSYKFNAPGVYKVTMLVKDQTGLTSWVDTSGDTEALVVVYDPSGGYTIGGGWIASPPGAFAPDPSATGKLKFGFNSQYFKNATNPKGELLVSFLAGEMEFNALNFDYLAISGAKAQFRGFGKINGASGYDFILTVTDGDLQTPKGPDTFRLKVWEKVTGVIIYDNEPGRSDAADPVTPVGDATSNVIIKK